MGIKTEWAIENADLQLKISRGQKMQVFGTIALSFKCPQCYATIETALHYRGGHSEDTERKCENCKNEYSVTSEISIIPRIGDRDEVELNRQMRPIVDRIKANRSYEDRIND